MWSLKARPSHPWNVSQWSSVLEWNSSSKWSRSIMVIHSIPVAYLIVLDDWRCLLFPFLGAFGHQLIKSLEISLWTKKIKWGTALMRTSFIPPSRDDSQRIGELITVFSPPDCCYFCGFTSKYSGNWLSYRIWMHNFYLITGLRFTLCRCRRSPAERVEKSPDFLRVKCRDFPDLSTLLFAAMSHI